MRVWGEYKSISGFSESYTFFLSVMPAGNSQELEANRRILILTFTLNI